MAQTYSYCIRGRNGWGMTPADWPRPDTCHQCGAPLPVMPVTGATGYGCLDGEPATAPVPVTLRKGETVERAPAICYACCHARDLAALQDRSRPFVAYLASDGATVTTWPGGTLGAVTRRDLIPLPFGRRGYYSAIRVVDVHGGHWYGRGHKGMAVVLRPCKGATV